MTKLTLATKPPDNRWRSQIKLIRNTFSKNDCKNTIFSISLYGYQYISPIFYDAKVAQFCATNLHSSFFSSSAM